MRNQTRIVRAGEVDPPNLERAMKKALEELERNGAEVRKVERDPKKQIAYISFRENP
jgi:Asp-tRNA(Asn)/Glu-tRNA(Gln) amidotransferase A subunit family amidase